MNSFICQLKHTTTKKFTYYSGWEKLYEDKLYTLIWNGEIYNISDLKNRAIQLGFEALDVSLEKIIVFLFMSYKCNLFPLLRGKFALVIWDKSNETLYGARDHFGVESLFYTEDIDRCCVTNSKSYLERVADSKVIINNEALQHYFTFQYVPEPLTMTEGCFKLRAGHFFIKKSKDSIQQFAYFTPEIKPIICSRSKKIKDIQKTLYECVAERMSQDTKIGSFLSGGIDSTIITAIAQQLDPNIKAFTIEFSETGYSEFDTAKKSAEALGVEHKRIVVTPKKYVQSLLAMIYYLEDPLADPSAVPLYIGCQEAKRDVDVLLSGEGADEMFGGYEIYREHESLRAFKFLPNSLKRSILHLANRLPEGMKGKSFLYRGLTPLEERYVGNAKIFAEDEKKKLLNRYCPKGASEKWLQRYFEQVVNNHPMEKMQYIDWHTWLPGDILFKASRLSQAAQLSIRLPFVDQKIYEIAKGLTIDEKIKSKTTKVLLREAAKGIVPEHIIQERKRGFPVPLRKWLRDELYAWANRNIMNAKTTEFINKDYAINLLNEHSIGKHDHSRKLWAIIIFNLWYEMFVEEVNLFEQPWHVLVN